MQNVQTPVMRYAGYGLALVIGVVATISGIAGGAGVIAGAGLGWLAASILLIVYRQQARVEGQDDAIFAIFDNVQPWLWGVSVALIAVGALVGFLIKH